ncbi:MAG: outer membrane protein assembly factor BamC [Gammaproteobacteria bacterium]|nr:outer membrane protein assembly factor BamC [Gammaproteobacteria bacterium]
MQINLFKLFKYLGLVVVAGSQLSCSYLTGDEGMLTGEDGIFRDRQGDYLQAPMEPDMRVPDHLDSYTLDQLYVVPDEVVPNPQIAAGNVPRPKPLDTNRPEGVVIRRFSGENWIVIAASPGQVWPRIRDFWTQQGTELDYENPVDGVMETVWLRSPEDSERREKFRLSIEPGIHVGSSEIAMVHIVRDNSTAGTELVIWPQLSDSEDREFALLQEVSQYLADRTDIYSSSSSSLLAGSLETDTKASLLEDRGLGPVLELRISVNRAWGQVTQALGDAGFNITSRDRDALLLQVEFGEISQQEQDGGGFFSRVFSRGDQGEQLLNRYQVNLQEAGDLVRVTAESLDNESMGGLETDLLQAILTNL